MNNISRVFFSQMCLRSGEFSNVRGLGFRGAYQGVLQPELIAFHPLDKQNEICRLQSEESQYVIISP